jgi:hypothetical protein
MVIWIDWGQSELKTQAFLFTIFSLYLYSWIFSMLSFVLPIWIFILSLFNYSSVEISYGSLSFELLGKYLCLNFSYKLNILFCICTPPITLSWWFIMIIIAVDPCRWFCFNVVAAVMHSVYSSRIFRCTDLLFLFFVCTKILHMVAVRISSLFIGLIYLEGRNLQICF